MDRPISVPLWLFFLTSLAHGMACWSAELEISAQELSSASSAGSLSPDADVTLGERDGGVAAGLRADTSATCENRCFYVRPAGVSYGAGDGSSYRDAWAGLGEIDWVKLETSRGRLYVCGEHRETLTVGASGREGAPLEIVSCTTENGATIDDPGILNQTELLAPEAFSRISEGVYTAEMSKPLTFAPLRNGERMPFLSPTRSRNQAQVLAELPDGYFYSQGNRGRPCGAQNTVYVRRDDGDLGRIEVGVRRHSLNTNGHDYLRIQGLRFYGGIGRDMPPECDEDLTAKVGRVRGDSGLRIASGSNHIELIGTRHGPGGRAANVGPVNTGITLRDVYVHDSAFGFYFQGNRRIYGVDPPVPTPGTSCIQTLSHVLVEGMTCVNIGRVFEDRGDLECLGLNTTRDVTVRNSYFASNGHAFEGASHSSLVSAIVNCNLVISHNYFYDGGGGMTHNDRDTGTVIAYNIFDGWGRIPTKKGHGGSAIWLGGSGDWMGEVDVVNNLFINGPRETKDDRQASIKVLREQFDRLDIKNNIFYDNEGLPDIIYYAKPSSKTVRIDNNVIYRSNPDSFTIRLGLRRSNTSWYRYDHSSEPDLAVLQRRMKPFSRMLLVDPLLTSTQAGATHRKTLRTGSACIDAGQTLDSHFDLGLAPTTTWQPLSVELEGQSDRGKGWEIGPYVYDGP